MTNLKSAIAKKTEPVPSRDLSSIRKTLLVYYIINDHVLIEGKNKLDNHTKAYHHHEPLKQHDAVILEREPSSNLFRAKASLLQQASLKSFDLKKFFKTSFPKYGYILASIMHGVSSICGIKKDLLPEGGRSFINKLAIGLSKFTTSTNYISLAFEALQNNRSFDFLARILDPLFVPWMKLEDIHLARGMSAGLTLMDFSQTHKLSKLDHKDQTSNFFANCRACLSMIEEMIKGGIGKKRKILPETKDEGHTMHFFGQLIMLGSALGIAFGANKRNVMNKIGGLIRNFGGFMGDITMILHGDKAFKLSGIFYAANAVIDAVQRFLPKEIIDPINHFNMILNNLGTYFYAEISRRRNQGSFTDSFV